VTLGGLCVHLREWEPRGEEAGALVLAVHGLGGCTVHWDLLGPRLAAAGRRVVAVDLPGCGLTRSESWHATVPFHAGLVEQLAERCGPIVLVGSSMGGAISVRVAARAPELAEGVVLLGAAFPLPRRLPRPDMLFKRNAPALMPVVGPLLVGLYRATLTPEQIVADKLRASLEDPASLDPRVRAALLDVARRRMGFAEGPAAYASMARTLFWYLQAPPGMSHDIGRVRCPVEMLHGTRDRLVDVAHARRMQHRRPDWALRELPGCGHLPQLERVDEVVDAVLGVTETPASPVPLAA